MGDAVNTPFDLFVFILIFGGIPFLIVALPIVVLVLISVGRSVLLNRRRTNESLDTTTHASKH